MGNFHMAGLEPPESSFDEVIERYEASPRFVDDAEAWAVKHGIEGPVEVIVQAFYDSSDYLDMLDDIADGIVTL